VKAPTDPWSLSDMDDQAGKTFLVTGCTLGGLGHYTALELARRGGRVVLAGRTPDKLTETEASIRSQVPHAELVQLQVDLADLGSVRKAAAHAASIGTIDVLINNAGVIQVGPLDHMSEDDFENAMATHFWGPLHLILEVAPIMRHRGFGRIVNISSIGGKIAVPHLAPYCASKFALTGLSDAVRAELDAYGIRVTTVAPGLMRTGSPVNAQFKGQHEAEYAWFKVASSLPGLTIAAERAARKIVDACRYGDPALTITPHAKIAAAANMVAPAAVARAMMLVTRLLPSPGGPSGNLLKKGLESEARSKWTPSLVTTLTDNAAVANNEI
jgi:NAD(P)-dependent dehydrogenase (short-subunit alcohol dehydrogenase family)